MFRTMRMLPAAVSLLALSGAVNAQTIINSIGNGGAFSLGQNATNGGQFIGMDNTASAPATPRTPETAGYVAQPFTLNALPGGATRGRVNSVEVVLNLKSPMGMVSSNLDRLYGAFFIPGNDPTTGLPSLAASTQVGDFFQFDTSAVINPIMPGAGDNQARIYSAPNVFDAAAFLGDSRNYYLVIAPTDSLNAPANTPLLMYGLALGRTATQIGNSGGAISNAFTTLTAEAYETGGAQVGSTLTFRNGAYYGVRVGVAVPEPSGVLMLLGAAIPVGAFAFKRRRNSRK
jgi:hypothetical protein